VKGKKTGSIKKTRRIKEEKSLKKKCVLADNESGKKGVGVGVHQLPLLGQPTRGGK